MCRHTRACSASVDGFEVVVLFGWRGGALGFRVVVGKLQILIAVLEPAKLLGNLVEGCLDHDSRGDDDHHVGGHEELTSQRRVQPLRSTARAAKEMTVVHKNSSPKLNCRVADHEHRLEP